MVSDNLRKHVVDIYIMSCHSCGTSEMCVQTIPKKIRTMSQKNISNQSHKTCAVDIYIMSCHSCGTSEMCVQTIPQKKCFRTMSQKNVSNHNCSIVPCSKQMVPFTPATVQKHVVGHMTSKPARSLQKNKTNDWVQGLWLHVYIYHFIYIIYLLCHIYGFCFKHVVQSNRFYQTKNTQSMLIKEQ